MTRSLEKRIRALEKFYGVTSSGNKEKPPKSPIKPLQRPRRFEK